MSKSIFLILSLTLSNSCFAAKSKNEYLQHLKNEIHHIQNTKFLSPLQWISHKLLPHASAYNQIVSIHNKTKELSSFQTNNTPKQPHSNTTHSKLSSLIYKATRAQNVKIRTEHYFIQFFQNNPHLYPIFSDSFSFIDEAHISGTDFSRTLHQKNAQYTPKKPSISQWMLTVREHSVEVSLATDQHTDISPATYRHGNGGQLLKSERQHIHDQNDLFLVYSHHTLKNKVLDDYIYSFLESLHFQCYSHHKENSQKIANILWEHVFMAVSIYSQFLETNDTGLRNDYFYKTKYFLSENLANNIYKEIQGFTL